jgi:hypothetical protein
MIGGSVRAGGVDADHVAGAGSDRRRPLGQVRIARARVAAWAAGAKPDLTGELRLDFDATNTVAHSEMDNTAATWK